MSDQASRAAVLPSSPTASENVWDLKQRALDKQRREQAEAKPKFDDSWLAYELRRRKQDADEAARDAREQRERLAREKAEVERQKADRERAQRKAMFEFNDAQRNDIFETEGLTLDERRSLMLKLLQQHRLHDLDFIRVESMKIVLGRSA